MTKRPDAVDMHVGERIRRRRVELGQSQGALAEDLGLSFQQVQKYERGANRTSASMLAKIARSQGAPIAYYFEGVDPADEHTVDPETAAAIGWLRSLNAVQLSKVMAKLTPEMQTVVVRLAEVLADT